MWLFTHASGFFGWFSCSGSSSFVKSRSSVCGARWRLSIPPVATEIVPVSSETMTTTASDTSLVPIPARWRVPRSLDRCVFSDSGMTQPAAATRPARMITAPSCSEALGKNRLRSSCSVTRASIIVPVLKYSSSDVLRSKISSTPTRSFDMISQALTVAVMAICSALRFAMGSVNGSMVLPPNRSSARRNSGWNIMTSAIKPNSRIFSRIQFIVYRCTRSVIHVTSSSTRMLRATRAAVVDWIRVIT